MPNIELLKAELTKLPLEEREELFATLVQSIAADHQSLAGELDASHTAICEERLERYEAGEIEAIPIGRALHRAFADR